MGGGGEKTLSIHRIGNARSEQAGCSRRLSTASSNSEQTSAGKEGTNRYSTEDYLLPSEYWDSSDTGFRCHFAETTSPSRHGVSN